MERSYLEQRSPNYPLELFREIYRNVPGRKEFLGLSYVFSKGVLSYGQFTLTNETPSGFELASPAPDMSQRVDGAGIITPQWAVIFVSFDDFGGLNNVEWFKLVVPPNWSLEYYSSTGKLVGENAVIVRFSPIRRNNYVVLAFEIKGNLLNLPEVPKMDVKVAGEVYSLPSSST